MSFKIFKKSIIPLAVMFLGVSCSKDELPTKLTEEEVKEIVSVNDFEQNMFGFSEKLNGKKHIGRGRSSQDNNRCGLLNVFKIEDGKFKYNFDSGCEFFGRKYEGKLEVEYKPNGWGYTRTLTYENFISDGFKITGTSKYDATLRNKEGHFLVGVDFDLQITLKDGTVVSRKGKIQFEKVEGNNTLKLSDDVFETSGGWESISTDGIKRSIDITKNLKRKSLVECIHTIAGEIVVKKDSKKYLIDFGNGECDSKVKFGDKEISL
ncbi:MAG: hypothetical protein KGV59_04960 [Tenacibaculum sp.]|nr:hypothetical protein [Tenacibaculum sp.]